MSIDMKYLNSLKLNRVNVNIYGEVHDRVPIQRVVGMTYSGNNLIYIVNNKLVHIPLNEVEIESEFAETEETV